MFRRWGLLCTRLVGLALGLALGLSVGLSVGLGLTLAAAPAYAAEWTLEKEADGIKIYTRSVAGSDIKEFKGEAVIDAQSEVILSLLRDANRFKEWFPNTSESKLIKREGDVSHQYSVMDVPWPITDRDNVFRTVTQKDDATGQVLISIEAAPDAHPIQKGRHRVTQAKGTWALAPLAPSRTQVTFIMHLEPGGGIPDWMVNARVVETPFGAISGMRATLAIEVARD